MDSVPELLDFRTRLQWRTWLEKYHLDRREAWLVHYKVNSGLQGISLDEAVEEALCFGWIDGKMKSINEESYSLRYSPRAPRSNWCMRNIRRVERLSAEGLMSESGLAKVTEAQQNGMWQAAIRMEDYDNLPDDMSAALEQAGLLERYFELTSSRKKGYLHWVITAKKPETRLNRINRIIAELGE
jgi:uncharacterized protein YdeI (YjbR/CyaY-like superfamily)